MKNKNNNTTKLIAAGSLTIAAAQIINRFTDLSDTYHGLLTGVGVGLMILALAIRKRTKATA